MRGWGEIQHGPGVLGKPGTLPVIVQPLEDPPDHLPLDDNVHGRLPHPLRHQTKGRCARGGRAHHPHADGKMERHNVRAPHHVGPEIRVFQHNKRLGLLRIVPAVGNELVQLLDQRHFPVGELLLLGSKRSAGSFQVWKDSKIQVREVSKAAFEGVDLVLASAGGSVSRQWRQVIN